MYSRDKDVKIAPNIYRTPYGFRVYVRRRDKATGKSRLFAYRFPFTKALEELEYFRDHYKLESKKLRREDDTTRRERRQQLQGAFSQDARTYLALEQVRAMPTYADRVRDIERWIGVFGDRPRSSITTRDIDQQLQKWLNQKCAASTVNHRRTALMHLWTTLDGRSAANPVRDAMVIEEPELAPRGIPMPLVLCILECIPDGRTHSHLKPSKVRLFKTKPRILLEALTGMRPSQIGRMERGKHFNLNERWYVIPRSKKGTQRRRPRQPRPSTRKYMTDHQAEAFRLFDERDCYGEYSASSRRRQFHAAVTAAEAVIRKEIGDPAFRFPADLVPYDLRHSFGSEILRVTGNLETTAEMLDHSTTRMTRRYALAAIPEVLKTAALAFEAAIAARPAVKDPKIYTPKAPRRRRGRVTESGVTGSV